MIERFRLSDFCDRPVRGYSRGQRQRTAIARVALADPNLLLLDEPETGLDEDSRKLLLSFVEERTSRGDFVLWVTHGGASEITSAHTLWLKQGRLWDQQSESSAETLP